MPKIEPAAPHAPIGVGGLTPCGVISTRMFLPVLLVVFPITRLPLKSNAELIGPLSGGPAKTTRACEADGPLNEMPLGATVIPPAGIVLTIENASTVLLVPSTM